MAFLMVFIGALIPTFLISRAILWVMRSWNGGTQRLLFAHAVTLLISTVIAGYGFAENGVFSPIIALSIYGPAQAFWFLADWLRYRSGKPEVRSARLPRQSSD